MPPEGTFYRWIDVTELSELWKIARLGGAYIAEDERRKMAMLDSANATGPFGNHKQEGRHFPKE